MSTWSLTTPSRRTSQMHRCSWTMAECWATPDDRHHVRWYVVNSPGPLWTAFKNSKVALGPLKPQSSNLLSRKSVMAVWKGRYLLPWGSRWSPSVLRSPAESFRLSTNFVISSAFLSTTYSMSPSHSTSPWVPWVMTSWTNSSGIVWPNLAYAGSAQIQQRAATSAAGASSKIWPMVLASLFWRSNSPFVKSSKM